MNVKLIRETARNARSGKRKSWFSEVPSMRELEDSGSVYQEGRFNPMKNTVYGNKVSRLRDVKASKGKKK